MLLNSGWTFLHDMFLAEMKAESDSCLFTGQLWIFPTCMADLDNDSCVLRTLMTRLDIIYNNNMYMLLK